MGRYLGRHVESIEADSSAAVDVRVINWSDEADFRRLEWVSVRHVNFKLEGPAFVWRSRRSLDYCDMDMNQW